MAGVFIRIYEQVVCVQREGTAEDPKSGSAVPRLRATGVGSSMGALAKSFAEIHGPSIHLQTPRFAKSLAR